MAKGSNIRKSQGFYQPYQALRTKETTGNVGPREVGPHGKTLEMRPKIFTVPEATRVLQRMLRKAGLGR